MNDSPPPPRSGAPAPRVFLWALLVATLLALFAANLWMSGRQKPPAAGPPALVAVPQFMLVDRDGKAFGSRELAGSPYVASFIFSRCGGVCPLIVERLKRLGPVLAQHPDVARVSITVDPDYDTPSVLADYARAHGIDTVEASRWHFLTGPPDTVRGLIVQGFKLALEQGATPAEPILHSTRLVLVDGKGWIRGLYEYDDEEALASLARDLDAVSSR
jgi:protein SCO1/2